MNKLRTLILVILIVLTTVVSMCIQLLIGMQTTILNPHYYSEIMQKHHLYDLPQNYILHSIKNNSSNLLSEPLCNALTPSINSAFSPEWTEYQSNRIISNVINYAKGNQQELNLIIPLQDRIIILKNEMAKYLKTKYKPEELANFEIASPDAVVNTMIDKTHLPNHVNILQAFSIPEEIFIDVFNSFKYYYKLSFIPYLIFVVLSILIIWIGKSYLGLGWLGGSILISGVLIILLVSVTSMLLDDFLARNVTKQSQLLATIGMNPLILLSILKNSIISNINKISVIFSGVGLLMICSAKILIKRLKNNTKIYPI